MESSIKESMLAEIDETCSVEIGQRRKGKQQKEEKRRTEI
jgi:hypothetical protein